MRLLSGTFQTTRVLVAFALLLSTGAPLVQYACGVTGETSIASAIAVEPTGPDTAHCGTVAESVHDRLCGSSSSPGCEGDACSTDTVEKQSVVQFETSLLGLIPSVSSGGLLSGWVASFRTPALFRSVLGFEWSARTFNPIPVWLLTLSFRL